MSTSLLEFLAHLRERDIKVWADNGKLRYNAPSGALTDELRARLKARKAELLAFFQQAQAVQSDSIAPIDRTEPLPLSYPQQLLWVFDQLVPHNAAYNELIAFHLSGPLDLAVLERSLLKIVRRHEVLRTTFATDNGQPIQMIHETLPPQCIIRDFSAAVPPLPPTNKRIPLSDYPAPVHDFLQTEVQRPFNLSNGPLLRMIVARLSPTEHALVLVMHHIVADGWSQDILLGELSEVYRAQMSHSTPSLPALPIQYADYAAWQRQWVDSDALQSELAYWRQQLHGDLPPAELPTDFSRPALPSFRGDTHYFSLPSHLVEGLRTLGQANHATLYMMLIAAFTVLLHRYSGQTDIVVGMPVANRNRPEIESLIGFFINAVVLRLDLTHTPSFHEYLRRVRQIMLTGLDHQNLPFEKLVEVLQPQRDLSRQPLYQIMVAPQGSPLDTLNLPDIDARAIQMHSGMSKFDMTLYLEETAHGVNAALEYSTDLFEATTIARMVEHYLTLIENILADPTQPITQINLMTADELHQMLVAWNQTQQHYPTELCLHHLFEAQVERTPHQVALRFGYESLTYRALNERANQLARRLQDLGVGPEVWVGLFVEPSFDMVIGLLAILKAGGAYIPLDPSYPAQRLRFILDDTKASLVLTPSYLVPNLLTHNGRTLLIDETLTHPTHNLHVPTTPESTAFVLYTSGSTGQPKGVMGVHRTAVNRLSHELFPVGDDEVFCVKTSLNFIDVIWEIFAPLSRGLTTVIIPKTVLTDPPLLVQTLARHKVTRLVFVPSFLALLLDSGLDLGTLLASVKYWISSGEALSVDLAHRFAKAMPHATLINLYGTSEMWDATWHVFDPARNISNIPIGTRLHNVEAYILDEHLGPVPVGMPGHLYIGGKGLARGYHARPALTAQSFIPHPFSTEPGQRLYRTGDLARYLPNGSLDFMGRADSQVKLRGLRIELGEIEAALREHPTVDKVAVIVREQRLVAYVVPVKSPAPDDFAINLRHLLQKKLPDYMIPGAFVFLDELPLTPNGKLDRRNLPAPVIDTSTLDLPRTQTEHILAHLWADHLGRDAVGIHDSFFELGGDSILAIQITIQARHHGLTFSLTDLFQHQTIAELAASLAPDMHVPSDTLSILPFHGWFLDARWLNIQFWGYMLWLTPAPTINLDILEQALNAVLAHHDIFGLSFYQTNLHHDTPAPIAIRYIDLTRLVDPAQAQARDAAVTRLQATLNLDGPRLHAVYFRTEPNAPNQLLLMSYPPGLDGQSWHVLLKDIVTAYQQLAQHEPVDLPAVPVSFWQWMQRLHDLHHDTAAMQRWLANISANIHPIPVDHPEQPLLTIMARTLSATLGQAETQTLLEQVPEVYRTYTYEVLLAALAQTFKQWYATHQYPGSTMLVELISPQRQLIPDLDTTQTVGWFNSVSPVMLDLDAMAHPDTALKSVKERVREAAQFEHNYGKLRYTSQTQPPNIPHPEIAFGYFGDHPTHDQTLLVPAGYTAGLVVSPLTRTGYLMELVSFISNGHLVVTWTYRESVYQHTTIERLLRDFMAHLQALIAHCQESGVGGYTPSDFPGTNLSQDELDDLLLDLDDL